MIPNKPKTAFTPVVTTLSILDKSPVLPTVLFATLFNPVLRFCNPVCAETVIPAIKLKAKTLKIRNDNNFLLNIKLVKLVIC